MSHSVCVSMGGMMTGAAPTVLETVGVGSCLVIVINDPIAKVGGLAHAMLPSVFEGGSHNAVGERSRYVDAAVDAMVEALLSAGARKDRLVARLVGGAHMFTLYGGVENGIGFRNLTQARCTLKQVGIPVMAEETGGTVGRNVRFDLASGICSVETHM